MKGQLTIKRSKTTKQHTKPCADCPWARTALRGWIGGYPVAYWLAAVHGEAEVNCHTRTAQCAGAAIYRANVLKCPRDGKLLQLPPDRETVFATPAEFTQHHTT